MRKNNRRIFQLDDLICTPITDKGKMKYYKEMERLEKIEDEKMKKLEKIQPHKNAKIPKKIQKIADEVIEMTKEISKAGRN